MIGLIMSLFHGTSDDNIWDKHGRRKHSKRTATTDNDIEPVRGSVYCRRRPSKTRRRVRIASGEALDSNGENGKLLVTKSKSKRHLLKEIERLAEENHSLSAKLEGSTSSSDLIEKLKEKDLMLLKIRSKYHKLTKDHELVQQECGKLKALIVQRDEQYTQLHAHQEELTHALQNLETTKASLFMTNHKFDNENAQLKEDVSLLKSVVYQLNVELERYQDKLKECGQTITVRDIKSMLDNIDTTVDNHLMRDCWGKVNTHALAPLLNAYQENILEKQELISKYEHEMEHFTSRCKEVIAENELLQKELEDMKLKYNRHIEESKTLTEDAVLVKEQNDLLTKQIMLQKQKLQEVHAVYEQKVESMTQDNNKLHKEYLTCKTELSNLQGKYDILNEGYDKLKSNSTRTMPISVHTAAVDECRRLFEELKEQYEAEKKKLTSRIKQLEECQPDTEKELATVTAERNHLKTLTKSLEKKLKHTERKLEHVQNMIRSMQTSRDSFKRQLSKTTLYCEELVTEYEKIMAERDKLLALLKVKEKESASFHHLGDNITQRMGTLKHQLKSVQKGAKEQLATVEKHLKSQELDANQMKTEYNRELQRLKHLVRQKEDVIGRLQREKCQAQDSLELVWKAATTEDKKVKDALQNTKAYNI